MGVQRVNSEKQDQNK